MRTLVSTFFLFLLSASYSSHAQSMDSMMNIYAGQFPQQKVHVHFDKGIYRAGETIWFKAYIFAGFLPALNSKSFYAELIDDVGNVVQRKVYPVTEATSAGNFDIPENFSAANLKFRGYTSWMLNFDTSFLFTKEIVILNKAGSTAPLTPQPRKVSLHFFPEGGDMVTSLESVIAFKANDSYGLPIKVKGNIKNSKGEVVAALITQHDGMGRFILTPEPNDSYTASYTDEELIERTATLPMAKQEGVVLKTLPVDNKKVFVIQRSKNASERLRTVFIVAHIGQQIIYKAKVPLINSTINSGLIQTDKLPSGILQLTVFDESWKPVAERIAMVNNKEYFINAKVESVTTDVNKRAKNIFEIEVEDTLPANLSISVTDAEIKEKPHIDNIISRLLLTGDLKGYVHNPSYYFSDSIAHQNIDLVMLTNGWRRYNWDDVVNRRLPVIQYPDTSYTSLTAKVFGLSSRSSLSKDESLTALIQAADLSTHVVQIPKTGPDVFSQPNAIFFDTIKVFYQFTKNRNLEKKVTLKFDNGLYNGFKNIDVSGLPLVTISASDSALARSRYLSDQIIKYGSSWAGKGNVLETVIVKTKVRSEKEEMDKKYTSGLFAGGDSYSFDFINDKNPVNDILTFLESQIPGLRINRNSFGDANITWRSSPTAVFINEMSADASYLTSLSVNDIAYIKVFRPPFMGAASGGSGGAIAVYTRRGGEGPSSLTGGLASNKLAGYSPYKEFYSPDYSTRSASADVVADYRSTLYWNPYILTDQSKQKVKIEFFNNDISKAFRVILEGINTEGRLVRVEKTIQ
jgi:hypothetical protein